MRGVRGVLVRAGVALGVAGALASGTAVLAQATASPHTYATRYDAVGRQVGTIAPDPDGAGPLKHAATRTTYDARGNPTKVETGELAAWQAETVAPASWPGFTVLTITETTFDLLNRKVTERVSGRSGSTVSTAL